MEIIRPNMQKNFLIARVGVSKKDLENAKVIVPANCKLYYFSINSLNIICGSYMEQTVDWKFIVKQLGEKKLKKNFTTLYWVIDKEQLYVPWGVESDGSNKGYHGSVTFKISKFGKLSASKMFPYATEQRDGLYYEYLSEYFITENKMHNGISIVLRDMFVPLFKNHIEKIIQCQDIQETVDDVVVKKYLDELGLEIVDINVTDFYPSTQSKNSESGDK